MLDILILVLSIVLLLNVVTVMFVMGFRTRGNSWLLALLLTGTTGAAVTALLAVIVTDEPARFMDMSLVVMGLASLPIVLRVMLYRDRIHEEADHAD